MTFWLEPVKQNEAKGQSLKFGCLTIELERNGELGEPKKRKGKYRGISAMEGHREQGSQKFGHLLYPV